MNFNYIKRINAWLSRKVNAIAHTRFVVNQQANMAQRVVGLVLVLFILGAIGGSAIIMASNGTYLTENGVDSSLATLWTLAIPMMIGIAVIMYVIPRR